MGKIMRNGIQYSVDPDDVKNLQEINATANLNGLVASAQAVKSAAGWTGTKAQWNALSATEKAKYEGSTVTFTDDYTPDAKVQTTIAGCNSTNTKNTDLVSAAVVEELDDKVDNVDNRVTTLNNNFGGIKFRTNEGKAEYQLEGADTWSPFKKGSGISTIYGGSNYWYNVNGIYQSQLYNMSVASDNVLRFGSGGGGIAIRNTSGHNALILFAVYLSPNTYCQYGLGTGNKGLPGYNNTGANRVAHQLIKTNGEGANSITDWGTMFLTVSVPNNNEAYVWLNSGSSYIARIHCVELGV